MCPAVHSLTRQNTLENEICMCDPTPSKKSAVISFHRSARSSVAVKKWDTVCFEFILTMLLQARSSGQYQHTSRLRTRS